MPRTTEAYLAAPAEHIPSITEPNTDFHNTPSYKRFDQIEKERWAEAQALAQTNPNKTWPKEKIQPIIDREIKTAERIYGPLDLDIRAEQELAIMKQRQAQAKMREEQTTQQVTPSKWPTGEYAPGRKAIIPSPEDFEKDADPEGNIL